MQAYAHLIYLTIIFGLIVLLLDFRKWARDAQTKAVKLLAAYEATQTIANDFLKSCRLISIQRNGRVNVFTFARNDQIFTIETVGLLSDEPREWRRLAGLE